MRVGIDLEQFARDPMALAFNGYSNIWRTNGLLKILKRISFFPIEGFMHFSHLLKHLRFCQYLLQCNPMILI